MVYMTKWSIPHIQFDHLLCKYADHDGQHDFLVSLPIVQRTLQPCGGYPLSTTFGLNILFYLYDDILTTWPLGSVNQPGWLAVQWTAFSRACFLEKQKTSYFDLFLKSNWNLSKKCTVCYFSHWLSISQGYCRHTCVLIDWK